MADYFVFNKKCEILVIFLSRVWIQHCLWSKINAIQFSWQAVGFHFHSAQVCALLTWGLCFLSPTEHTIPAPNRATMRDNEKDQAACSLWKCASITTNQASRVMKAAAAAFFIGTGAANRKRHQRTSSRLRHIHNATTLCADVHNMRRLRAKKRPLSSLSFENILIIHKRRRVTTTRGKGSNFITAARHAWPNEMRLLWLSLCPPRLVFYGPEKDARLEWEDKKLYGFYVRALEEKCHSPGLSLNRINNAERMHFLPWMQNSF